MKKLIILVCLFWGIQTISHSQNKIVVKETTYLVFDNGVGVLDDLTQFDPKVQYKKINLSLIYGEPIYKNKNNKIVYTLLSEQNQKKINNEHISEKHKKRFIKKNCVYYVRKRETPKL